MVQCASHLGALSLRLYIALLKLHYKIYHVNQNNYKLNAQANYPRKDKTISNELRNKQIELRIKQIVILFHHSIKIIHIKSERSTCPSLNQNEQNKFVHCEAESFVNIPHNCT